MATKKPMSENSRKVLNFLKEKGVGAQFTVKQMMTELGFEKAGCVTGSINSFVKKNLVDRTVEVVEDENGKTTEVKYFSINQAGLDYDPDAVATEEG